MFGLFQDSHLKTIPDISKWKTDKLVDIRNMFKGCSSLVALPDISKWCYKCLLFANNIFEGCSSLVSIPDISKLLKNQIVSIKIEACNCSNNKKCSYCYFNEFINPGLITQNYHNLYFNIINKNNNESFSSISDFNIFNDKKSSIKYIFEELQADSLSVSDGKTKIDNSSLGDSSSNDKFYSAISGEEFKYFGFDDNSNDIYEKFYN